MQLYGVIFIFEGFPFYECIFWVGGILFFAYGIENYVDGDADDEEEDGDDDDDDGDDLVDDEPKNG